MPTASFRRVFLAAALILPACIALAAPDPRPDSAPLQFEPYGNESDVVGIGPGLTVENRLDRVTIAGDVDLTLDRDGAAKAEALRALLDRVCSELQAREPLPPRIETPPPETVDNPFE
jgi:hypothetical protein